MESTEIVRLLAIVKATWYQHPTDRPTVDVWAKGFEGIEYVDASDAVMLFAKNGNPEPPTWGQVRLEALNFREKRLAAIKRLPEPDIPEDQRQRNIRYLRDCTKAISEKKPLPDFEAYRR